MNYTLHVRPEAEDDIEDAAIWYEKQQKNLGYNFLDELSDTFSIIKATPNIYPQIYKKIHRAVIHRFPFNIYYFREATSVIIVAVMHGSRHPKRWKNRV